MPHASIPAADAPLSPALFSFLSDLAANNDRAWFEANRDRYDRDLRRPLLSFVAALRPALAEALPEVVADPRPVGGSVFRLHRDTRFSKDKRPYKTNAGAQFRHLAASKDVHMPGLYLHLEPGACWIGLGIWRPAPPVLRALRRGIAEDEAAWLQIGDDLASRGWRRGGMSAKRTPPGFTDPKSPPTGRLAEELRRTDHIWTIPLTEAEVCDPNLAQALAARGEEGRAAIRWLADRAVTARGAGGVGWAGEAG